MKLNIQSVKNKDEFESKGINVPNFDIEKAWKETNENTKWIHFGAGNIFRAFIAKSAQKSMEKGNLNDGIVVAEPFDFEVIDKAYKPYDNLSLLVTMTANGELKKDILASISDSIKCIRETEEFETLKNKFKSETLQMVSFTITEKGYSIKGFEKDIESGPDNCKHTMCIVTSFLYERFLNGAHPIAVVSMDNCSNNGEKLGGAIKEVAKVWVEKGFVTNEFLNYINNENKVSFPFTMIDKITPRPDANVKAHIESLGFTDADIIVTSKNTYTASFVNAESAEYLVIEDCFPNGKPDIASDKVYFTNKETVKNVETMKVTTCLNPLHTALAVTGCVLGYDLISEEMKDETLLKLINKIGYEEGMKVVVDPKIISPKSFIDEVVNERLKNPYIPDTPQRIATDTSQKVDIRFCETIKSYTEREDLDVTSLVGIPLAIASWIKYLDGVKDNGETFDISPDPLMDFLMANKGDVKAILNNKEIFHIDLYQIGLGEKIENYYNEMCNGKGAFRSTLEKYL